MNKFPIKNPKPDFDEFIQILKGVKTSSRVPFAEFWIDEEIKKIIIEKYFNEKNIPPPSTFFSIGKNNITSEEKEGSKSYYKQLVNFWKKMGYSFFVDDKYLIDFMTLFNETLSVSKDNSIYSKGQRAWAQEGTAIIKTFDDFEKFPWEKTKFLLSEFEEHLDFISKIIPDGIKIAVTGSLFEQIMERVLGYMNFFYLTHDQPTLVESVVNKIGQIMYDLFSIVVAREEVGILLLSDDLGYKTSTIISLEHLRKWFFPWYIKYSSIAHKYNKQIWYHCCGYKYEIVQDLINNIEIDAIHGFEESCSPVIEFKKRYGTKIGILGGVDIDKLVRLNRKDLLKYVNDILEACMKGNRFALGSGNSFCNYIPIENYFLMIEAGLNWT